MATASSTKKSWLQKLNDRENYPFKFVDDSFKAVFCKVCEKSFGGSQKWQIVQHCNSEKHKKNAKIKDKNVKTQKQLVDMMKSKDKPLSKSEVVGRELCSAMLAANIPWSKLEVPQLREFLEKNIGISIPSEAMLRQKYMQGCYDEVSFTLLCHSFLP